jgi:hypothetical protein
MHAAEAAPALIAQLTRLTYLYCLYTSYAKETDSLIATKKYELLQEHNCLLVSLKYRNSLLKNCSFLRQRGKVKACHDPGRIPTKAKGVTNEHGHVQQDNGRNGKQKDFGIGQKGQGAVAEVGNVPVPTKGRRVHGIGNKQWQQAFTQGDGNGKVLHTICVSTQIKSSVSGAFRV